MKLRPLGDRVVVKPLEEEERTRGGIVLPDTAKEKPQHGEVIAVGPGEWDEEGTKRLPLDVKVGDRVLFAKYSGAEVKLDDEDHLILRQSDILAIVERTPAALLRTRVPSSSAKSRPRRRTSRAMGRPRRRFSPKR